MKPVLFIAAALLAVPALAADAGCDDAKSQSEMNICADQAYRAADAKLNAAYAKLMGALGNDGFKTKLKAAQRAWVQFRDTECTYETADNEGGSIHPMVYAGCLTRLTTARTKELDALLVCWKDAEKCGM
jgi:uncharacterized protein YecT (DUF1311 family)